MVARQPQPAAAGASPRPSGRVVSGAVSPPWDHGQSVDVPPIWSSGQRPAVRQTAWICLAWAWPGQIHPATGPDWSGPSRWHWQTTVTHTSHSLAAGGRRIIIAQQEKGNWKPVRANSFATAQSCRDNGSSAQYAFIASSEMHARRTTEQTRN